MKLKIIFVYILMTCSISLASFKAEQTAGNRAIGLGGAFTAVADDVTAMLYNPAGLVSINKIETEFEFVNLFGITELNQYTILAGLNSRFGAVGFGLNTLQYSRIYNENLWMLSYANYISANLSLGINLKYFDRIIDGNFGYLPEYKFLQKLSIDLSALVRPFNFFAIGITTFNVNKPALLKEEGPAYTRIGFKLLPFILIDSYFKTSLKKTVLQNLILSADIFKSPYQNSSTVVTGIEYKVADFWAVRAGTDWIEKFSFGAGFYIKNISINYSFVSQTSMLNNNHFFSIGWLFK